MEILLFQNTGLDKNYHNVIAHADFSAWVNARRTLPTTAVFTVPKRTFFDGDTLDLSPIDNYASYDYAAVIDGERVTGLFIEPVFADSTFARYSVTMDMWSALPSARFVDFTIEQSTVYDERIGGIPLPFLGSGNYSISSPFSGQCWAVAFVSDSGTFSRSGVHTFVAVGPISASYEAYATAVDLAKTTSVSAGGKDYSVDAVSAAYVIPADLLPAAGNWGERVIPASITVDVPGMLPYSGYFYKTWYENDVATSPSGIEKTISVNFGSSDYGNNRYFGNFSQFIELPVFRYTASTITTILTPAGGLSVRVLLLGEEYDFAESLRVDAYYTGEDATTRAINAGSQLVASVGSAGLSAASGSPVAITGAAISAGGSIARTLSDGRAYSYRGGGFRDACTVGSSSGGSPFTVLMPGLFVIAHEARNAADRHRALNRYGRIYHRIVNGDIELQTGKHFTYYRGSGTIFPAAGWLSEALEMGMTLWDANGVNQI